MSVEGVAERVGDLASPRQIQRVERDVAVSSDVAVKDFVVDDA